MKTKIIGGVVTIGVFPRRRRNCGWGFARGSPPRWWRPVQHLGGHPAPRRVLRQTALL